MRSPRLLPGTALLVTASAALALLHACQDAREPTEPDPAATFATSAPTSAAVRGKWGPVFSTPVVAVDAHLLPTGKVLLWGDQGDAQLLDPANLGAGFTAVSKTYRIFCSGHTFLPDGRLLVTGGVVHGTLGDPRAVFFVPSSGSWVGAGPMAQGRYYPTATALPNGEILAVSGNDH